MKPSKMVHKTLVFYTNLCNVYKDEEEREENCQTGDGEKPDRRHDGIADGSLCAFPETGRIGRGFDRFYPYPEPSCSPVLRGEERKRWQRE